MTPLQTHLVINFAKSSLTEITESADWNTKLLCKDLTYAQLCYVAEYLHAAALSAKSMIDKQRVSDIRRGVLEEQASGIIGRLDEKRPDKAAKPKPPPTLDEALKGF